MISFKCFYVLMQIQTVTLWEGHKGNKTEKDKCFVFSNKLYLNNWIYAAKI